jgi:HEAT repeat protein
VFSALDAIKDPRVVEPLIAFLKDSSPVFRSLAARELSSMDDPRASSALLAALQDRNSAAIAGAFVFFIQRGQPGSEDAMIDALNQFGDWQMASAFRHCGNAKLEEAANAWRPSRNSHLPPRMGLQAKTVELQWGHPT